MRITSRLTMAAHMVCAIDYFGRTMPVTSTFLAGSIGTSPVMVRTIMGMLKQAGIISSSKGKSGITLARPLADISLLDLWRAVDRAKRTRFSTFTRTPAHSARWAETFTPPSTGILWTRNVLWRNSLHPFRSRR